MSQSLRGVRMMSVRLSTHHGDWVDVVLSDPHPLLPRVDVICWTPTEYKVITGMPAPVPVAPTVPADTTIVATVYVRPVVS